MIEFDKLFENEIFLKKLQVIIDERLERLEQKAQKNQNEVPNDKSFNESVILPRNQESTNDLFGEDDKNQRSLRNEFEKMSINHRNNEENISQFIEEIKKDKEQYDQSQDILGDINQQNQSDSIFSQADQLQKKKELIIGQLNNVLVGITQYNIEQQLKKLLDQIENRLGRCEKVCLEKLVMANSSNQLNNQNLESISKNFTTIHSEIKKINSFLDVIQEEQLHFKLKIEESFQNTKKPHHSRNKSVQNQNNFINGQYNSMGGGDFIPDVIAQEMSMLRIDIDVKFQCNKYKTRQMQIKYQAKDESIKHLEHKIIKVQQDCFKLEEDQEEKFKIFEEKIINIWQSIAFMTENITEINRKLEKKKSGIFF